MWRSFIDEEKYLQLPGNDNLPLPIRQEINKSGSVKKRVIYSYPEPYNSILKGIAYLLYRYDDVFGDNCYAFRRNRSAGDALGRLLRDNAEGKLWCLKLDISDYFNSIDIEMLLDKLEFMRRDDERLFELFAAMLRRKQVLLGDGSEICDEHGAMAGIAVAPFFANIYLKDADKLFENEKYYRYSDDILILAESREALEEKKERLLKLFADLRLKLNEKKLHTYAPGEAVEFLGFAICAGNVDLSEATKKKLKDKVSRKARALQRWSRKKKLPGERAAKGFIRALNRKLYSKDEKAFSWSRWFFPHLTADESLKELDAYILQYIRYTVTGRHYKGNYRISYEKIKEWGYRSLVHEWWEQKQNRMDR
ncbi:MAG: reverse transcriptase/maturase family protein [Lachnospiraceae bacterium]|nr:reverse transcriptase/maturase family protein [Lachnospiraceae bacterium]